MGAILAIRKRMGLDEQQQQTLVAAAERIRIDRQDEVQRLKRRTPQDWQPKVWGYYDEVPEVKYGVGKLGDIMSKLRMVAAVQLDPETDPIPVGEAVDAGQVTENEAGVAVDTIRRLNQGGGHAEIYRGLGVKLTIPGECYLIGLAATDEDEENWGIYSPSEVTVDASGNVFVRVGDGPGGKRRLTEQDFIGRIWLRHQDKGWLPDSPMRAVLNTCEELLILDRMARGTERSRNNAGILLMPTELDDSGPLDPTQQVEGGPQRETTEQKLMRSMTQAILDEGSASAVMPHVLYGKADVLDKVRHIDLQRTLDNWVNERTERALRRLANGLNLPAEEILGMADVNHWTSWQIEDSTFKAHVEPLAVQGLSGITTVYFRPMLRAQGLDNVQRFVAWYDASKLVARPNRGKDADALYDRWAISWRALRDAKDFEETDAPDEAEIQRRLEIENAGAPKFPAANSGDQRPEPDEKGPPANDGEDPAEGTPPGDSQNASAAPIVPSEFLRTGPASLVAAAQVEQIGQRLTSIDRQLRERLLGGFDASMRRALERAGARLVQRVKGSKDSALKELIKGRPAFEVAAVLGPRLIEQLGESEEHLLDGAFEDVRDRFERWVAQSQRQALAVIPRLEPNAAGHAENMQRLDRQEAWDWVAGELRTHAGERLYEPNPKAPARGEYDSTVLVGASIVRGAMARAGGAEREQGQGFSLGVASGLMVGRLLQERGIHTAGWRWVYGDFSRTNPFEPHEQLDGLVFDRFDSEELVNNEGFPAEAFYTPGDHEGCICDWERVTVEVVR